MGYLNYRVSINVYFLSKIIQCILKVQDSLKWYFVSSWNVACCIFRHWSKYTQWYITGHGHRSCQIWLPVDTSTSTYLHRDAGFAPEIQNRLVHTISINPGQYQHVSLQQYTRISRIQNTLHVSHKLLYLLQSYMGFPMWVKHLTDLLDYGLLPMWAKRILGVLLFLTMCIKVKK